MFIDTTTIACGSSISCQPEVNGVTVVLMRPRLPAGMMTVMMITQLEVVGTSENPGFPRLTPKKMSMSLMPRKTRMSGIRTSCWACWKRRRRPRGGGGRVRLSLGYRALRREGALARQWLWDWIGLALGRITDFG
ncbi:hypothetical protein K443DRAFT_544041 [Laccaria amethystina LaAM-08-1]|uniref:Uncharacterized protein n=1 Tax=Laccaria amethystina LaAM-08-1 TaxID=1095629 RepID=A0A0C9XAV2_9AGAR|nr:hypothetical protein K443DRAFT_544041 [Laccaria amethystina LaAM-08-1]